MMSFRVSPLGALPYGFPLSPFLKRCGLPLLCCCFLIAFTLTDIYYRINFVISSPGESGGDTDIRRPYAPEDSRIGFAFRAHYVNRLRVVASQFDGLLASFAFIVSTSHTRPFHQPQNMTVAKTTSPKNIQMNATIQSQQPIKKSVVFPRLHGFRVFSTTLFMRESLNRRK